MAAPLDRRPHDRAARFTCRWEDPADGPTRLVVEGELTRAVWREVTDALHRRPVGLVPRVEIDLAAAVLLDVKVAYLLDGYRAAAADRGEEVRVVNASGTTLRMMQMLGLTALLDGEAGARNGEQSPRVRSSAAAVLLDTSRALVAASCDIRARSQQLCAEVSASRERANLTAQPTHRGTSDDDA